MLLVLAALVVAGIGAALYLALGSFEFDPDDEPGAGADSAERGTSQDGSAAAGGPASHTTMRPAKVAPGIQPTGAGAVRGQVRLFKTRAPVAGLVLALKPPEGAALSATTDAAGNFEFKPVPAGAGFELRGQQAGYAQIELTGLDLAADQTLDVGVLWLAVPVDLPAIVVDTTGRPIEGAEVAAFALGRTLPEEQNEWSDELREQRTLALVSTPRPSRTAKTDAAGRATVAGLMPGAYRAVASAKGFAPASRTNLLLVPDAKPVPARFVLGPAHGFEGTVTDEHGAPVAKAQVIAALRLGWLPSLDKSAGETADDGKYRVEGLAAGGYFVYVAREGRPLLQVGTIGIPETTRFDIRLRPGGTIQGRVTDEAGKPVASAEIHASMQDSWSPMAAKTDKDGNFALKDVPAGPLAYFHVDAKGFVPFPDPSAREQGSGESLREGQTMVRDVVLRRGASMRFRVVGEGAGPIEGAQVRLHLAAMWSGEVRPWTGVSDAEGRAEVTGLMPGDHLIVVAAEGWVQPGIPRDWGNVIGTPSAFPAQWHVVVGPDAPAERELRLARGSFVAGRVLDPGGKPAPGAVVSIDGVRREFPVFSGSDGTFRVDTVPALRRGVARATGVGGATGESEPFAVEASRPAENVEVRMKEAGRVTGTVSTRDGTRPAGAIVRWIPGEVSGGDWWQWRRIETAERYPVSAEGAFEIPDAPAGQITVRADAEGMLPAFRTVTVASGVETGGVGLLLGVPRAIRGRAESQQGTPVPGATVYAYFSGRSDGQEGVFAPGLSGSPVVQSGADGRFEIPGLSEGNYQLWGSASGFAGGAQAQTSTNAGEVVLRFAVGKSVTGVVKDPEGKPFPGIPVMAERADGQQRRGGWSWGETAYTAPDGTFELQDLAEGNYRLKVSGAWQWGREVNVEDTVKEGVSAGDRDVEIVVRPGLVIEGRLVDKDKHPVRVGWVSAQYHFEGGQDYQWGTERWVQVRPDGTFRITGLRPGPYDLWAYGSFRQKETESVAAGTTGLDVQVDDAWVIEGVVLDDKGFSLASFDLRLRKEGESEWDWCEYVQPGDGAFVLTGLEEGRYDVQVTVDAYAPAVAKDVPAGRRDLTVRILKGLDIGGVVTDAAGRPVAHAWVNVESTRLADGAPPISTGGQTDENGRFKVPGLLPGEYSVVARAQQLAPTILRSVAAGKDDLKLAMGTGTTVSGSVVDGDGRAVPSVNVSLWDESIWVGGAQADAEGKFEIRLVPSDGKWTIGVQGQMGGSWFDRRLETTVEPGATGVKVELK